MKRTVILFLICAVLLTGCGFAGVTYQNYVTAVLECTYHHDYEGYQKLTNATIPEADSLYWAEVYPLSERIQDYYGLKPDLISDEMKENYNQLAEKILKKTKYNIRDVVKSENGYTVTLVISPVDFWEKSAGEVKAYYEDDFTPRYSTAKTKASADKLEEVYAFQVLKILNAHVDDMAYAPSVIYEFEIRSGENGVSAQTWQEIDSLLLNLN